jgi:O-antigen ligase
MSLRLPLALLGLLGAWVLITNVGRPGDPWPVVGALAVAAGALVAGFLLPDPARWAVGTALGVAAMAWVLAAEGPLDGPLSQPLGYANANAALVVQGAAVIAVAAASSRRTWLGWLGIAGACAAVVLCLVIGAAAATAGALLVLMALVLPGMLGRRVAVLVAVSVLAASSALAFVVGAVGGGGAVERAVSERRVALWTDGVDAVRDSPWLGAGAREFPSVSPTAAQDADTREAHAELLQRATENGLPGLGLEAAALAVVVAVLAVNAWRDRDARDGRLAAVGLAGVCALWANAGVDWILAFPAVVALGGLVAGMALPRRSEPTTSRHRRQRGVAQRVEPLRK